MYCHAYDPAFALFISDPDSAHAEDFQLEGDGDAGDRQNDTGYDMDLALIGLSSVILGALWIGLLT